MSNLQKTFRSAKSIAWDKAIVSLYIVHRKINPQTRQADYSILGVNTEDKLRKKLRGIAFGVMSASNRVAAYDFNTADQDQDFLGISASDTDMAEILSRIAAAANADAMATKYDDLVGAWLYIARLHIQGRAPLFAVRRISQGWTTKKVSQLINVVFTGNMLIDIEQDCVFKIDSKIDFFAYGGVIFIADKKNFEAALNFRAGMEKARDEVAQSFVDSGVLGESAGFVALVGNNMRRLRKLAQVKKAGYYTNPDFMKNLMAINAKENWGLTYAADGTLVVTEENIEIVLRVLNNDRLRSPINEENFDVEVKHKI